MPDVPDPAIIAQAMRKGHKIRAMLDDDQETAQIELFYAWHYLLFDHDPPDNDADDQSGEDEDEGGP